MKRNRWMVTGIAILALLISPGCQSAASETQAASPLPSLAVTFSAYRTITPSASATQPSVTPASATPLPSATPTPRTHVVQAGEDMSGIALRYRVPLTELKTANPAVNPRMMKIGISLIIPGTAPAVSGPTPPTATPRPVEIGPADCALDLQGGAWCFIKVHNQAASAVINLTLRLSLLDASGKQIAQQQAALPLDLLPAGAEMPLGVYFPAPLPANFQVAAQMVSALPASATVDHYPPVQVSGLQTVTAEDRRSAEVRGQVGLVSGQADASTISILVIAYDGSGAVVGLRRWDSTQGLRAGGALAFQVRVYSTGGLIQRLEVRVEARK